ncbi:unnamed protein product, partial [Choristocarpus tenellus]
NLVKLCSEDWKFISVAITSLIFAAVAQVDKWAECIRHGISFKNSLSSSCDWTVSTP